MSKKIEKIISKNDVWNYYMTNLRWSDLKEAEMVMKSRKIKITQIPCSDGVIEHRIFLGEKQIGWMRVDRLGVFLEGGNEDFSNLVSDLLKEMIKS